VQAHNRTRGCCLAEAVAVADRPLTRLRGLIGRPPLGAGEGMLITPCSGIHTFFMGSAIDVVFLDHAGRVVAALGPLAPWRLTRIYPTATSALELPPGTVGRTGTTVGDLIEIAPPP